jgi:Ca-activated chloride channel family protein
MKRKNANRVSNRERKIETGRPVMTKQNLLKISGVFLSFLVFGVLSGNCFADGFIIPRPKPGEDIPPLTVKYHRVNVEIIDQVATTAIDQVFINNASRDIEGTFIFPLPANASISEFSLYIGGKKVKGEILEKDRARQIYEDIVRRMKDPALLEYVGRNMFRARVYPIPAKGEKRIQLSYTEVLKSEANLVHYIYPLDTERFSFHPIKDVSISVAISSNIPISSVYSPSHKISVRKEGERKSQVSFEASNVKPDKDFSLYYSLTQDEIGLSLLNWEGKEENYYMLLASPPYADRQEKIINKNLIFVLDSSGSMSGKKIEQAKEAVRFVINHLEKGDRFAIVDFDDGVDMLSSRVVPANSENKKKALDFVDAIEDSGGTNINDALLHSLKMIEQDERPTYILFLTDGLPTVGITGTAEILKNISQANSLRSRIVVFGVGYDVNTELLDRISLDNRGTSVYLGEDEDLEVAVSNYYEKISSPLLADLKIDFTPVRVKDSYPRTLPDLFKGSQLVVVGKYTGSGPVTVILSGKVAETERTFALKNQELVKNDVCNFLPRIWATRRIGYLLEEIRLHGEKAELVDEVKKLGLKYGIVTPYTSFLVTEEERERLDIAAPEALKAFEEKQVTGAGGVRIAKATQRFKAEEQAVAVESRMIRYREDKTFYLRDGFWVDSEYVEGSAVRKIGFNSEDYFKLVSEKPGISKYLSVAKNLIICYQGVNYKIAENE